MLEAARPLLLVGGGKMGEALLAGWLAQGVPAAAVRVVEPAADRREWLTGRYRVPTVAAPDELGVEVTPAVLLLAIKPQVMDADAFAHSTVTPRPTAAGVLGIARTTARPTPSARSNSTSGLPAAIDNTRVSAARCRP